MSYPGIALFLAAVIGIGFAAYQYYSQYNPAQTQGSYGNGAHTYRYEPPADISIDRVRKRKRRSSAGSSATDNCTICYEALSRNIKSLACKHSFHVFCIEEWFKESKTCPICRCDVR